MATEQQTITPDAEPSMDMFAEGEEPMVPEPESDDASDEMEDIPEEEPVEDEEPEEAPPAEEDGPLADRYKNLRQRHDTLTHELRTEVATLKQQLQAVTSVTPPPAAVDPFDEGYADKIEKRTAREFPNFLQRVQQAAAERPEDWEAYDAGTMRNYAMQLAKEEATSHYREMDEAVRTAVEQAVGPVKQLVAIDAARPTVSEFLTAHPSVANSVTAEEILATAKTILGAAGNLTAQSIAEHLQTITAMAIGEKVLRRQMAGGTAKTPATNAAPVRAGTQTTPVGGQRAAGVAEGWKSDPTIRDAYRAFKAAGGTEEAVVATVEKMYADKKKAARR